MPSGETAVPPGTPPEGYAGRAAASSFEEADAYKWEDRTVDDRDFLTKLAKGVIQHIAREGIPEHIMAKHFSKKESRDRFNGLIKQIMTDLAEAK